MVDIKVKRVSEESFSSVAMYLEYVLGITKEMGIPYFIDIDGTRYFVTKVRCNDGFIYACSYEKDGKMKSFGLSVPDANPECVSLTDGVTIYRDFSRLKENPFIIKENVINDNTEQVAIGNDIDGQKCLVYFQENKNDNMDCEIIYSLKNFEDRLSAYMNYIDTKYPKSIEIGEDTKILKVIKHRKKETYRYCDSQYLIPKFKIFGFEFADVKNVINLDEALYNVRINGFNPYVPKTISDLLTQRSDVENNMKTLAKIYDESFMKLR